MENKERGMKEIEMESQKEKGRREKMDEILSEVYEDMNDTYSQVPCSWEDVLVTASYKFASSRLWSVLPETNSLRSQAWQILEFLLVKRYELGEDTLARQARQIERDRATKEWLI